MAALLCASCLPLISTAQNWKMAPVPELFDGRQNPVLRGVSDYTPFRVDESTIANTLSYAPQAIAGYYEPEGTVLALPQRDGSVRHYRIMQWDMLSLRFRNKCRSNACTAVLELTDQKKRSF